MRLSPSSSLSPSCTSPESWPQYLVGVAELALAVRHEEIDRLGRPSVHDHAVKAGALQLRSPVAAGLGLAEAAGQRRLAGRGVAVGPGERQAVDDAGHKHEQVVRPQGIDARW